MKYKMKLNITYTTKDATSKEDAKKQALNHFRAELERWHEDKINATETWNIEIIKGE